MQEKLRDFLNSEGLKPSQFADMLGGIADMQGAARFQCDTFSRIQRVILIHAQGDVADICRFGAVLPHNGNVAVQVVQLLQFDCAAGVSLGIDDEVTIAPDFSGDGQGAGLGLVDGGFSCRSGEGSGNGTQAQHQGQCR